MLFPLCRLLYVIRTILSAKDTKVFVQIPHNCHTSVGIGLLLLLLFRFQLLGTGTCMKSTGRNIRKGEGYSGSVKVCSGPGVGWRQQNILCGNKVQQYPVYAYAVQEQRRWWLLQ